MSGQLTRALGSLDVRTRLVPDQQPRVLGARFHRGYRVPAVAVTAVVGERVRRLERALHRVTRLPEHGVQQRVTGDQRADALQRALLVAERCGHVINHPPPPKVCLKIRVKTAR